MHFVTPYPYFHNKYIRDLENRVVKKKMRIDLDCLGQNIVFVMISHTLLPKNIKKCKKNSNHLLTDCLLICLLIFGCSFLTFSFIRSIRTVRTVRWWWWWWWCSCSSFGGTSLSVSELSNITAFFIFFLLRFPFLYPL